MLNLLGVVICMLLGFSQAVTAAPVNLNIVTGSDWLSTADPSLLLPGDWTNTGFDDSGWSNAQVVNPPTTPQTILGGPTSAQFIWDPTGAQDASGPPNEVWLRYTFNLALAPDSLPLIGQALVAVDDDFQMFVNGVSVFLNADQGFADQVWRHLVAAIARLDGFE